MTSSLPRKRSATELQGQVDALRITSRNGISGSDPTQGVGIRLIIRGTQVRPEGFEPPTNRGSKPRALSGLSYEDPEPHTSIKLAPLPYRSSAITI